MNTRAGSAAGILFPVNEVSWGGFLEAVGLWMPLLAGYGTPCCQLAQRILALPTDVCERLDSNTNNCRCQRPVHTMLVRVRNFLRRHIQFGIEQTYVTPFCVDVF